MLKSFRDNRWPARRSKLVFMSYPWTLSNTSGSRMRWYDAETSKKLFLSVIEVESYFRESGIGNEKAGKSYCHAIVAKNQGIDGWGPDGDRPDCSKVSNSWSMRWMGLSAQPAQFLNSSPKLALSASTTRVNFPSGAFGRHTGSFVNLSVLFSCPKMNRGHLKHESGRGHRIPTLTWGKHCGS